MFEVGAQLNTSCLKKTDARVEQEMRERPEGGRVKGGWGGGRKSIHEKNMLDSERKIWKSA